MATADLPKRPLKQLRKICLALPESTEKETWGSPTFRVRDKIFAAFGYSDLDIFAPGDEGTVLVVTMKAAAGEQEGLLASGLPFFRPKYVGHRGWIGVGLDADSDWAEIEELIIDSYCEIAPKTLVKQLSI
jgi:predicted DNA-binding protein (MmcQ/YjbR family)